MNLLCRIGVIAACTFAAWWSGRMAWADWLAASDAPDGVSRAVRLEPGDARLVAVNAELTGAEPDLQRALQLNPFDSTVLMMLGLRAEFRGDKNEAEHYFRRAADVDHQFKPAWALANYYVRAGEAEKIWPLVDRCLRLDPLGFDPAPIFDLCWNATSDPDRILAHIPRKRPRLIQYFSWLVRNQHLDAAVHLWPMTLQVADVAKPEDSGALIPFCSLLVAAGRVPDAVDAWNDMVKRGLIRSRQLAPGKGVSIADPRFDFAGEDGTFAWRLGSAPDLFVRNMSPSLQFELDGREPESISLLHAAAPVVGGRSYKLFWQADGSRLDSPHDPGFSFRVKQGPDTLETPCPLLAASSSCTFETETGTQLVQLELIYSRTPGTVRAKGNLRLLNTALEFAP